MADGETLTPKEANEVKIFVAAYKSARSPYDKLEGQEKAFVEACKAFTMIAGAGATSLNMFAVSMAYMSSRVFHANDSSQSTGAAPAIAACAPAASPAANKAGAVSVAVDWMLIVTFFCFLYTCCTAAVAHATVHRVKWLQTLAVMIYFELFLLSSMCGLYYYMLTDNAEDADLVGSICFPLIGFLLMFFAVRFFFRVPRHF